MSNLRLILRDGFVNSSLALWCDSLIYLFLAFWILILLVTMFPLALLI